LAHRSPDRTKIARAISALAEPEVAYPVLLLVGIAAARRDSWRDARTPSAWWHACVPCLVVAAGAAARKEVSRAVHRSRPPQDTWLAQPEGFSLPSKHTTLAALTAGAGMRALGASGLPAHAAPGLAAAGVGASRVYLGVHWPADVLAGWLFAEGWLRLTRQATRHDRESLGVQGAVDHSYARGKRI
jgi:undecaprenyl-diphosphatase